MTQECMVNTEEYNTVNIPCTQSKYDHNQDRGGHYMNIKNFDIYY